MDLAVSLWEKNMIFACHTIAHGTNLRISPLKRYDKKARKGSKSLKTQVPKTTSLCGAAVESESRGKCSSLSLKFEILPPIIILS